ncbi:MAG TPA: RHS repeat-associated core domain-containing protein, partial [Armatimonadota bacterium]|nr:RHS repeat-associated core domain-containing protein [Armatimonadota bacterium]
ASYQLVNEQRSGANAYNTTFLYDGVGNRTVKNDSGALTSYSYNPANELTLITPPTGQPTTSLWDANGNLLSENAGGSITTYSWNGESRLVGVAYPTGAPDTMSYSADGLRQKKVTGSGTTGFVWDGQNVLMETDASGLTQAHYTDHPGMWGGLASQRRSGASSFFGFDQQANSRVLVTSAGGPSDSYLYGAFGEELSVSGSTVNALRFGGMVGYYRDLAARLYVRARHYEPAVGRWISRDPLGFLGGDWNLYGYGRGRPTVLIDPTGAQIPIACIGCAACVGTIIIASLFACYGSPIGFLECLQCWLDDHPWAYAVLIGCAVVCAVCIPVPVPTPVPVPIPTPVPVPVGAPAMAALSSGAARLGDRPYPWSDDGGFGDLARAPCKRLLRRCVCENWWTDQDCGNCYRYCRHYNCWPWQKCHPRFGGY